MLNIIQMQKLLITQLKSNQMLKLNDFQCAKILNSISDYPQNLQAIIVNELSSIPNFDKNFIHFLQNLRKTYRILPGLYNDLNIIMNLDPSTIIPVKETSTIINYPDKSEYVTLDNKQQRYLGMLESILENSFPRKIKLDDFQLTPDTHIFSPKGKRGRLHQFLRSDYHNTEEVIQFGIHQQMSLNSLCTQVGDYLSYKFLKKGYYPLMKGLKFKIELAKSINDLMEIDLVVPS